MKKQQGAVLIVSLIILLVTTLLGVTAMQSTSLEMRMAKNVEERQRVFNAAEAALRRAENILQATPYTYTQLDSSVCAAASDQSTCFDDDCTGGYCFFGDSTAPDQVDCLVYDGAPPDYPVWNSNNSLNVWNTGRYRELAAVNESTSNEVTFKYVVEFQCYVDGLSGEVLYSDGTVQNGGDALYRITVLATNSNAKINVMLQSTYGVPMP